MQKKKTEFDKELEINFVNNRDAIRLLLQNQPDVDAIETIDDVKVSINWFKNLLASLLNETGGLNSIFKRNK